MRDRAHLATRATHHGRSGVRTRRYWRRLIARTRRAVRGDQFEYVWLLFLAVVVGGLAALGNLGLRALIGLFTWLLRGIEWQALGIPRGGGFLLLIPVVLCTGGVVLAVLEHFFPRDVLGYGFPNFLAMVHLGGARIKRSWILLKAIGAAVSLGAGASVGREGPIAQIGGSIGATIGQLTRLSAERSRVLVACGAGAGIATTFNAPIGGLLFAQELVLLGETELGNLTLLIIATTAGVITSGVITGNEAVFHVQPFVLESYRELISYALMGIAMGLLSAGYIRFFHAVAEFFKQMRVAPLVKLLTGLSLVGLVAIPLPDNLSDGYPVINQALAGTLPVGRMAPLAIAKIFASSVSLGCGAPGGVFGPVFFIGAMAGGVFRRLSTAMFPGLTGPRGSYALCGLGAFLAGTTHAPLTAVFLQFEMTREYQITVPALLCCVLSLVVARSLQSESIDTYALAREGKRLHVGKERRVLAQIPVSAVMSEEPMVLSAGAVTGRQHSPAVTPESSLEEALQHLHAQDLEELPVVERSTHRAVGLISRQAIASAISRATVSLNAHLVRDGGIFWSTDYRIVRLTVPAASTGRTLGQLRVGFRLRVAILAVKSSASRAGASAPIGSDQILAEGDLLVVAGRPGIIRAFEGYLRGPEGSA